MPLASVVEPKTAAIVMSPFAVVRIVVVAVVVVAAAAAAVAAAEVNQEVMMASF